MESGIVLIGNEYKAVQFETNNRPDSLVFIEPSNPDIRKYINSKTLILPRNLRMVWDKEKGEFGYPSSSASIIMKNVVLEEISNADIYTVTGMIRIFLSKSDKELDDIYLCCSSLEENQ
jgi:hypothetical protein